MVQNSVTKTKASLYQLLIYLPLLLILAHLWQNSYRMAYICLANKVKYGSDCKIGLGGYLQ